MAYHPLKRSKTINDSHTSNKSDVIIQDEGYHPLKTKYVPKKSSAQDQLTRSQTSSNLRAASSLQDGNRGVHSAISHGLLMQYQAPVFIVKRPKYIRPGPFNICDAPDLRMLKKNFRKDYQSQVLNKQISLRFYEDLELEDYFSQKENWQNTAKFMNTSSFFDAVNVYLPLVKNKNVNALAKKYTSERNSRVSSSMTIPSMASTSQSRIGSSSRMLNLY